MSDSTIDWDARAAEVQANFAATGQWFPGEVLPPGPPDWDALAARVQANFAATGSWFLGGAEPGGGGFALLPPDAVVGGRSVAEWTEAWWSWILQSPDASNPGADPTGAFAGLQPENPVFFIAGTGPTSTEVPADQTAERSFDVPDVPLLIPMLNFFSTLEPPEAETAAADRWPGTVTEVFASIDGVAVEDPRQYLVRTDFFSAGVVQPDSVIDRIAEAAGLDIEGTELDPTLAVGYWLVVDGLSPGPHTIVFGGSSSEGEGFSTRTTVHITVDPDYVWPS